MDKQRVVKMAQKHIEHTEQPMTRAGTIQGPSRRYRRLRHPSFPAAEWAAKNPLLQRGEIGYEVDTHHLKVGDGVTYWNDLPYIFDDAGQPLSTADYQMGNAQGGWTTMSPSQQDALNSGANTTNIGQIGTNTTTIGNHIADTNNPHGVTAGQVGLGNVDNTSDLDKPISTATQSALDLKANSADLATVAISGSYTDLINKPTIGDAILTIQKNGTTVDSFTANATSNKTINITVPTTAADVNALPDSTKYTANVSMTINSSTYVVTLQLKDQDGNNIGTAQTIDLPLESVVVSGSYDSATKEVVLTLQDGSTIRFSVADLVSGLQSEITANNMLDADLVDDSTSTNKFVTAGDITTWNGKQDALTAGSNITISGSTISATDTTYTAGTGISISSGIISNTLTDTNDLTNGAGFITGITSSDVTTALGYTPYSDANPNGYTSNVGTVTSVNNTSPDGSGNVSLTIPTVNNPTITITQGGATKGSFTLNQASGDTIALDAGGGGSSVPVGIISPFGGSTAPDGWLVCDGSAVSRTYYADLFAVVGTTYGTGDGSTTFNLPDCNGRVPIYDSTATLGDTTNGKAPNIKGHIPCPKLGAYGDWTGVFYADVSGSTLGTGGWSSTGGTMDASRASQVYDDNASKITPAGVYTLICIKY